MNEMSEREVWSGQLLIEVGDQYRREIINFFSETAGADSSETDKLDINMEDPWYSNEFNGEKFTNSGTKNGMFFVWDRNSRVLFVRRIKNMRTS